MIARLLISPSPQTLASHMESGNVNHPDTLYFKAGEKLGIAEARKIKEHFSLKPYSAKGRSVIIEDISVMTLEAQNALLKTIEELPANGQFLMRANSDTTILPTILSRCEIVRVKGLESRVMNNSKDIEKLLKATPEQRFEVVEKTKNREELLQNLIAYFRNHITDYPDFANKLLEAEKWVKQNVNIRAILEYLMLEMPTLK
ncbi:hypothetical protein HYS95_00510 [Candidatus Daviesbacteria bacterium]|nr:hypothetical protein [Candidatus Daviesbacteria bacterium]